MKSPVSRTKLQILALSVLASASITAYAQDTNPTNPQSGSRQWQVTAEQQSAAALAAQNGIHVSELREDAPQSYRVQTGDTLWGISGRFLKSPWKWPALWGMNKNQINNPHLIYPGQVLTLVRNGDRAVLTMSRAGASGPMPTVRLSPRVRMEDITDGAIPVLPPEAVIPFLRNGVIVSKDAFDNTPRIAAGQENRLLLRTGDKVYVRGGDIHNSPEKFYMAYANPVAVTDPDNKKNVLGYEATFLGRLQYLREGNEANITDKQLEITPTLMITEIKQEIRVGDRLTAAGSAQDLLTDFVPHAAPENMSGRVVSLYGQTNFRHSALYGVILLSKGELDGIERGHVVALWRPGKVFTDNTTGTRFANSNWGAEKAKTPDERYGLAMVFKTFDHLSYALVVQTSNTVELGDNFTAP